ncbi:GntR family transcriptional regulator [Clostridium estertheticum]|uniref:GntR family transcriptional regulator n=1 Tax=Clostridium estertheticum TaxID=238834 RepID=UPI0013E96DB1|nr:GntR family transcriptional regulator [Clostridium estertheticum]MBZ9686438.1 GntR family transcriptional regulator [Clostridium estertheticum]
MNITIDYTSDLPMYEQIKASIKSNILCGKLQFNDTLPSVRQLAKELNVSTITTKRSYTDLEHEGLIYTVSGKGTFVNTVDVSKLLLERNNQLIKEYENMTLKIMEAGVTKENIINIIENIYRGE